MNYAIIGKVLNVPRIIYSPFQFRVVLTIEVVREVRDHSKDTDTMRVNWMNMISEWISGCLAAGPRKLLKCKLNPGAFLGHKFLLQNTQSKHTAAGQNPNPASLDSALLEKSGVFVHFLSDVNALDFLKGAGTGDAHALCGWEVARPLLGVGGREGGGARGGGGGGGARVPRVLVPRSRMERVGSALCYL